MSGDFGYTILSYISCVQSVKKKKKNTSPCWLLVILSSSRRRFYDSIVAQFRYRIIITFDTSNYNLNQLISVMSISTNFIDW